MLEQYLPILVFILMGIGFGIVPLLANYIIAKRNPTPEKLSPYECGFPEFEDARMPFDVRYYLIAIIFIIFDLETAFMFPWAVVIKDIHWFGLAGMALFLGLLTIGFVYEWRKGGLEWE